MLLDNIVDVISLSGVVLVDHVEGVPSEVDLLGKRLSFTVSSELFIGELSDIDIDRLVETFFLHPLTNKIQIRNKIYLPSISREGDVLSTDSS